MSKVQVILSVDDEVKGIGQALIDLAVDIKNKAALGQYVGDISKDLAGALGDLQNLSSDFMSNADNRSYLGMVLEDIVDAFVFVAATAAPVAAPAVVPAK